MNIENFGTIEYIEDTIEKSNYVIKLNSKEITLPIIIRIKEESDVIEVKNLNGSKKIKRIFIDEKINKDLRDSWPIVTDSKNNYSNHPNYTKLWRKKQSVP